MKKVFENPNAQCKTIATGSDNGFLSCATKVYSGETRCSNNSNAFSNLASCIGTSSKSCMIVGHASPGLQLTGNGDSLGNTNQYLTRSNRIKWITHAKKIAGKASSLILLGCSPGADNAGADLLYYLAKATNCSVYGPTYLVWCGNGKVYLDSKARWQTATPQSRPTPIPKPIGFVYGLDDENLKLNLIGNETMTIDNIISLQIQHYPTNKTLNYRDKNDLKELLNFINWGRPFVVNATPLSIKTGKVYVEYEANKVVRFISLTIYNDELLEDDDIRGTFYHIDNALFEYI